MPSDKIKFPSSDGEGTFTSKITRFWENCKWMTSLVSRHKTDQPSESSKVKNLFLSGWTKDFLKEHIFSQTRNRDARTENQLSRSNPKNSPENSKKPSSKRPGPGKDHARLERCDSSTPLLDLSSDKPLAKAEKSSTVPGRDPNPCEREPGCSSLPIPPTSPELTNREPPRHYPVFSYSKFCSAPADNEWRDLNSYRSSSSGRCAHQSPFPSECLRSGPYSRTQRLLSTDRITTTETSARERLLHRDCPFKTNGPQNYFYQNHGLDGVPSDRHTPSQPLFKPPHSHSNCCPFSWKKQDDCICRVDCLNSNICSTNSAYCCRSRSYLPAYEYSNDTYSIYTTDDDGQVILSRNHLDHHCLCYTHVPDAEALRRERLEPFKRSSWKVIQSNEERLSRRDVGTSTADLLETERTRLSEVFSSDRACDTREMIKRFDAGFEPGFEPALNSLHKSLHHGTSKKLKETYEVVDWSVTSRDLVTGQVFPQAKTGNVSGFCKFRNFDKKRSGSFPSPHQSWKSVSDRKNRKWMSAKDYKYSEEWRLNPLESGSTEELESLRYLRSVPNFYPTRQLGNLTSDSDGKSNSPGNCLFSDSLGTQLNSQDVHGSVSKNSRPRIISDANSNISRRQFDRGCKKHTIINEGSLQSIENCVDQRLKADATRNGIVDIKKIKTDLTNYSESDTKSFSSFEAANSKKKDRFCTFKSSSKPTFRALEKLVRYFASTPKKGDSKMAHAQEKRPLCLSPDLLNQPEETATYTEATDVPTLAALTKNKTFSLTDSTANAAVSNYQFPSNLSPYAPSEFFSSQPILEKTGFPDTIPGKRFCRNPSFLLKPQLTTDCDSLSPHSLVPLITMNLTSSSKKSATRLSLSSINAGRSQSGVVDNSNPVSNDLKFRRSSSKIVSFQGDFKISEQEEVTDFSNLDNEVFEPELSPCKYSNIPVSQLNSL